MNLILRFLSNFIISTKANKGAYSIIIFLIIGYFALNKYHFEPISDLNNEIVALKEDLKNKKEKILILDANISTLDMMVKQEKDECRNRALSIQHHSIQEQLNTSIEEIKEHEKSIPDSIGMHTLNLND